MTRTEIEDFRTFKHRGQWVEAKFITEALRCGYRVLKPWGDCEPFDVALNFGDRVVRVQVKSTTLRAGTGYRCHIMPNRRAAPYTLDQLDFFAAYIIPQDVWYLIPACVLLNRGHLKKGPMLFPMRPLKKNRYLYEAYKEAWGVLRPESSTSEAYASCFPLRNEHRSSPSEFLERSHVTPDRRARVRT